MQIPTCIAERSCRPMNQSGTRQRNSNTSEKSLATLIRGKPHVRTAFVYGRSSKYATGTVPTNIDNTVNKGLLNVHPEQANITNASILSRLGLWQNLFLYGSA
ncbi:MAG: hypothetical protein ACK5GD_17730 [Planctomycetota bacterium]